MLFSTSCSPEGGVAPMLFSTSCSIEGGVAPMLFSTSCSIEGGVAPMLFSTSCSLEGGAAPMLFSTSCSPEGGVAPMLFSTSCSLEGGAAPMLFSASCSPEGGVAPMLFSTSCSLEGRRGADALQHVLHSPGSMGRLHTHKSIIMSFMIHICAACCLGGAPELVRPAVYRCVVRRERPAARSVTPGTASRRPRSRATGPGLDDRRLRRRGTDDRVVRETATRSAAPPRSVLGPRWPADRCESWARTRTLRSPVGLGSPASEPRKALRGHRLDGGGRAPSG